MKIVQIGGNVGPTAVWFATENAYVAAFEGLGHEVVPLVQKELCGLDANDAAKRIWGEAKGVPDLVLYTRTHNDTALLPHHTETWRILEDGGVKTASVHLDVFWGLPERETWMREGDPMFTTQLVCTADGGSQKAWDELAVNHLWLPPAADLRQTDPDQLGDPDLDGKIVFVGSEGYHPQWPHRGRMVEFLRKHYGTRFVQYGGGSPRGSKRGEDLDRIYASDCLIVGDFCFAGKRANYWSDRIPETLGRGGALAVTYTPGINAHFEDGEHLLYWQVNEFDSLTATVDRWDAMPPEEQQKLRDQGRALVQARDTYPLRAETLLQAAGLGTARR